MSGNQRLKSIEEYHAMAMLLGYTYEAAYHMFDAYPKEPDRYKWLDPDTLELIPLAQISGRYYIYKYT